ncbi:MAG: LysR family transcriptional regulator [Negativicutes bacterium]|nr:LysR family transcriptional regulator [Negativicutes bacterium]
MELRELEYFQEVCRTGSFTRAAANLYVAQPCITNAIRKLEAELSVQLLNRTNKTVSITPEGQLFLERITALLSMAGEITQEMRDLNTLSRGSLKLGVPPQICANLFPSLFMEFGAIYPNLNLSVFEEGSVATISLLEKGELDVGIVILPDATPELNTRPIRQEPIVLCVSPQHPLSGQAMVDFAELKDEKFILRQTDSFHRDIVIHQCHIHGFTPNIVFSSNQVQTIKSMVAKNVGIAFFMEMVVKEDRNIVAIPLQDPLSVTIGLAWKKGRYTSKAALAFIDFATAKSQHPAPVADIGLCL